MRRPILAAVAIVAVAAVVTAVVVLLVRPSAEPVPGAGAPVAGCAEVATEELFVQYAYECPDGSRVVTFATSESRDTYLEMAAFLGAVELARGDTWARIRL